MSAESFRIHDQHAPYFITCTVFEWIDVFSRSRYRDIVVDSLNYCVENKGLRLFAWVIMSNHIHLVASVQSPDNFSDWLRDFKKHTSKTIVDSIHENPESRRKWLLNQFHFAAKSTQRATNYKFWRDQNHPILLGHIPARQKIDYIHRNPVKAGIVAEPQHYLYSSAIDYCGGKGMVKVEVWD